MPFKTKNRLDQNWWGIERKVGRFLGSPKADVMLVQTLLNAIQQTENGGVFIVWSVPPPSDELVVDGLCGSITTKWILWFQQAQALCRDGIVDPVFPPVDDPTIGGDRRGSLSGKIYAISQLNKLFALAQPLWHLQFEVDERTHPFLRASLAGKQLPG